MPHSISTQLRNSFDRPSTTAGDEPVLVNRFTPGEVLALSTRESRRVWTTAIQAVSERHSGADDVELASGLVTSLPPRVVIALHRFRTVGSVHNTLLIRGTCADLTALPTTPDTLTPDVPMPVAEAAALVLLAVSLPLGEPFTFRSLQDGQLVQNILPVPGHEDAQTSAGSVATLQWHVEDGFSEERCDYFGLLCLRGHPGAVTFLAPVRRLDLADECVRVLREPRFVIAPDTAHDILDYSDLPSVPVLTGPAADPEICFGEAEMWPADPADHEAALALKALTAGLDHAAIGHELRPGDVLLADNRRTAHGRTTFHPRYDGADRWLLRTMTCASLRAHRRRGALRALDG